MVCLVDRILYLLATLAAGSACLFVIIGAAGPWVNSEGGKSTEGTSPYVSWVDGKVYTWEDLLKDTTYPDWLLASRTFLSLAIIACLMCGVMHLVRTCGAGGKILTIVAILVNIAAVVCLVISLGVFGVESKKNLDKLTKDAGLDDVKLKLVWGGGLEIFAILLLVGSTLLAIVGMCCCV